ncbi:MAG: Gldg family protein [Pseudobacter sp.]|uniref:Gldg family protein n=1 Tax=Pseudobacter sp. TaxID=2045420 RepID=UPI003F7F10DB
MKIIYKIARAELRTLFYSPVAWVVIIVFFVISGMQLVNPLMEHARIQEAILTNSPSWDGFKGPLTLEMFLGTLTSVYDYLYLFIPLLTMGAIGREVNTGTINLLSSSPVRVREIIAGKYLGLLAFNLILLLSVALLLITGYFSIEHAELKWFMSMLLGFFLLSSAYLAIGLYISCLTSYQLFAALLTFIVFFLMSVAGSIFQQYDLVRDITYFLGMAGRCETLLGGLITTRDLFYFLLIIPLFLGLAMIRLKKKQESRKWTVSFGRNLALIAVILTLGYFSSRPGYVGYLDVTRDKLNTLDSATQAVLKEMDGSPLTVTLYTNLLGANSMYGTPDARNNYIWKFWDQYVRFYPNIKYRYVLYYDIKDDDHSFDQLFPGKTKLQIAERFAELRNLPIEWFTKPEEARKMIDLSRETDIMIMELEYKGKRSKLRTFDSRIWPTESNVSAAVRGVVRPGLPNVMFTTGHYERSPWRNGEREYGMHTTFPRSPISLINTGFYSDTISILRNEIPDSTSILVVADPKSALDTMEQRKILDYIRKGGNALFYAEPGKQQILNPVLNQLGVNLENGIVVRPGKNISPHEVYGIMNHAGNVMAREASMQAWLKYRKLGGWSVFSGSSIISYLEKDGFRIEPIVNAKKDGKMWIENGIYVWDSAAPVFTASEGDIQRDNYVLAVKLSRILNGREQRIVVTGDADFMSPKSSNGNTIASGLYSWLVNNEYPVYTRFVYPMDVKLTISKNTGIGIWYTFVYILPGMLLASGIILLIRRKRK